MAYSGIDSSSLDSYLKEIETIRDALAHNESLSPEARRRFQTALAMDLLLASQATLSQAAEVAGMEAHRFAAELEERGIPSHLYLGRNEVIPAPDDSLKTLKVSVVMPCYNEIETIREILQRVRAVEIPKEILIIDDCSKDGTRDLLKREIEGKYEDVRVLYHEKNQGKGAALRTGFQHATGSIVLIQDADLEYNPQEYYRLIQPILEDRADVVYGSRFAGGGPHRVHLFWHSVGNRFLTTLSNMFTNLNLTDMETCYKVFRAEIIKDIRIEQNRFGFEPEITARIAKKRARVYETPISYHGRDYSEGKKIGWKDGFQALWCIVKYRFFG